MTDSGWVKLHRRFLHWEWADNPDMVALWIHLLLMSNHDSQKWHGINIERGQCLTGRIKLAKTTGLSPRSIRTCLTKLKTTGELTIKSTNQYSIITICNYDKYQTIPTRNDQQNDQQTGHQATSDRPATDHKQELKELKNVKKSKNLPRSDRAVVFPPSLDTPECRTAWDEWLEFKRAKGQKYKSATSQEKQLKRWINRPKEFIEAIDWSMAQNYTGIFAENKNGSGAGFKTKDQLEREDWERITAKQIEIGKKEGLI